MYGSERSVDLNILLEEHKVGDMHRIEIAQKIE